MWCEGVHLVGAQEAEQVLQEGGIPGDLTVAETGRMWAGTLTFPRPVAEALELVDLAHRSRVTVKQLSG